MAPTRSFLNPTPDVDDRFGGSVAISGKRVLVGAQLDDAAGTDSGAAYLFDAVTGKLSHTFLNPTPATHGDFGRSVSVSGGKVLVGARRDDAAAKESGAAYLFDAVNGNLLQTFRNPTPAVRDHFGWSVAVSGDRVLIGVPYDDAGAKDSGVVYLFDAVTGNLLRTFLNPAPAASDRFGSSVAISGDKVLVGAPYDDAGAIIDSGAAHLFDAVSGDLLHTFLNPTPAVNDAFAWSVAISGDKVLIPATSDDTQAENSGAAYLFDAVTGNLLRTFFDPTPAPKDFFGRSVAITGNKVLVGADWDDPTVYLFDAATGNLLWTFLNPTPAVHDRFGSSVAISGDKVLVAAVSDDAGAKNSGAVYLFDAVTGNLLRTFLNPAPADDDSFGISVAISGDNVLVPTGGGGAYLFEAVSGNLSQSFRNPTRAIKEYFGDSVAISGNKVLVGAHADDAGAIDSGAAYLFDAVTGKLSHTFLNPTPAVRDAFGDSVAISGNKVLIGAPGDNTGAENGGAAYLFDAVTGNLLRTFLDPAPERGDYLGSSVAISGDKVLVGARLEDAGAYNSGAAYLFDAVTGKLSHTFLNPTPAASDAFGDSVAISGNNVLVGAVFDDAGAPGSGAAYLFDAASGKLSHTFLNPRPAVSDNFGSSVAISGNKVLVGTRSGIAYLYDAVSGDLLHSFLDPTPAVVNILGKISGNSVGGHSVAISGDMALVGALRDDAGATDSGAVYLFLPAPREEPALAESAALRETKTALAVSPPARPPTAHQCDRLAANPSDPRRVGEGVAIEDISPDSAIAACRSAVGEFPKNPRFQYQLGRALQKGERDEDAIAWYRMAVAQGYAPAQNNLGRMYANGRGVAQDDHEAVRWYREAAAQGYAPAQNSLGFMYVKVRGVAQDDHQAVRWFRKAAEQGNANGQNNLGFMYSKGRGVEKDENLAVAWYRKAAEQGDKLAQKNLGWMYQKGRGVAQDNHEAVRWFRKAAEQGYARGQASLGFMYEKGLGVEKDENLAVEWYRKAAEQGDKLAQKNLRNLSQRSR